ncbi:MAG: amidohydrolase family protein [Anaerolineaceae bacterium]|nr:amidohydrolase family protein [Anaerolineaceae bacterium]
MSVIVDCHCHVGVGHDYQQTVEHQISEMDTFGIDRAVICPVDRFIAVDNREGNDFVLEVAQRHPERFYAFATANPWYGAKALTELRRAFDQGARGIKLHPSLQGFLLCDDLVYPIIELAGEKNVPIFFHTGTPAFAQPMHVVELALRFPQVKMIMGHMGSTDFWLDAVPSAQLATNIYVDTSWSLPDKVHRAIQGLGIERVLFSSDSPLSSYSVEMGCRNATILSEEEQNLVMGKNMLQLLGEA